MNITHPLPEVFWLSTLEQASVRFNGADIPSLLGVSKELFEAVIYRHETLPSKARFVLASLLGLMAESRPERSILLEDIQLSSAGGVSRQQLEEMVALLERIDKEIESPSATSCLLAWNEIIAQ